jgi:PIN domain nuclease of toxin-antitoxin system
VIVLLDTHALIWAIEDSPRLSDAARSIIVDARNLILASATSAWEIEIKKAIGRLSAPDDLEEAIEAAGFTKRSITFADARRIGTLPRHHLDPFDRMLIAQAQLEGLTIVTSDAKIARYQVAIMAA